MRRRFWFGAIVFCLAAGQSAGVFAQGRGAQQGGRGGGAAAAGTEEASTKEESSVTEHTITSAGR